MAPFSRTPHGLGRCWRDLYNGSLLGVLVWVVPDRCCLTRRCFDKFVCFLEEGLLQGIRVITRCEFVLYRWSETGPESGSRSPYRWFRFVFSNQSAYLIRKPVKDRTAGVFHNWIKQHMKVGLCVIPIETQWKIHTLRAVKWDRRSRTTAIYLYHWASRSIRKDSDNNSSHTVWHETTIKIRSRLGP